jgi:hypothetical protein
MTKEPRLEFWSTGIDFFLMVCCPVEMFHDTKINKKACIILLISTNPTRRYTALKALYPKLNC